MTNPSFCVIIPNFNYRHFLEEAIQSCLMQTQPPDEILVCDNASTDESVAMLKALNLNSLKIEVREKNLGLFENLNLGLRSTQCDYVKILCADDLMHSRCLELLAESIQKSSHIVNSLSVGIAHELSMMNHDGENVVFDCVESCQVPRLIGQRVALSLSDMCYKRDTFLDFGGFGITNATQDYSLDAVTALKFANRFGMNWTHTKLVFERPHPGQHRRFMPKLNQIDEFLSVYEELSVSEDPRVRRAIDFLVSNHMGSGFARCLALQGTSYLSQVIRRARSHNELRWYQFLRGAYQVPRLLLSRILPS
ncbi:MAG: glycosyltransferase family 2 protein [Planctomycetota bacterium]|nr:glycosyltransferase family 2 protein [Planctomycetota bacterium]